MSGLEARRHRAGVLHGRRAGRPLRAALRESLARTLPALEVELADLAAPAALFAALPADLHLEIGFGGGEHLLAEARRRPEVGFIGCEPFRNGVARLVREIEGLGLANLRLHAGDAGEVLDHLPDGVLGGIDILYPDPWPKRRQRKRRFVSDARLDSMARVLRPGATLHFATDIDDYAGWVLARVLRSADFCWEAADAAAWRTPWPFWASTRYESKALLQGRRPVYLTFRRR